MQTQKIRKFNKREREEKQKITFSKIRRRYIETGEWVLVEPHPLSLYSSSGEKAASIAGARVGGPKYNSQCAQGWRTDTSWQLKARELHPQWLHIF